MPPNIEKNATRDGWRGWDAGKRLWQICASPDRLEGAFMACNGERYMWAASLPEMATKLAATCTYPARRTFPI